MSSEITFKATPDQVRQIFANAINAADPEGLGILHYKEGADEPPECHEGAGPGVPGAASICHDVKEKKGEAK